MRQSLLSCSGVGWQRKVLKTKKNKKKKSPPRTFAVIVRNKVPSLLLAALRPEWKQEKQLLERLSHKALKSYQHDGWDWGGDTYGPMHYPGMRSLWQSPANFHQHLAFPSPSSPGPPLRQALLPGSFFCASSLPAPCSLLGVCGCWPLDRETEKGGTSSVWRAWHKVEGVQSHGIVSHQNATDCWYFKGRKLLTLRRWVT